MTICLVFSYLQSTYYYVVCQRTICGSIVSDFICAEHKRSYFVTNQVIVGLID